MISYTSLEFEELISTSDFLRENQTYFPHMTFVKANHQTEGRGQYDRKWESEANQNLLFSILLKHINVSNMLEIKRWVISNMMNYLRSQKVDCTFKEPNDIYVNDKKICGILIETQATSNIFDYLIIGIGLNVNQVEFTQSNATSLGLILNRRFDTKDVFNKIIHMLLEGYEKQ
jgi:biotin-[acetyl-CoA-carboxylase] ligase BirA-like protein